MLTSWKKRLQEKLLTQKNCKKDKMYRVTVKISILLFIVLAILSAHPCSARIVDKIVAVVNDEVITQSEVDRLLFPIYSYYKENTKTEEELYARLDQHRIEILRQLIDDKLLLSEARKHEISIPEGEINKEIETLKKEMAKQGADFGTMLKEQNFTLSDLKQKYREQAMIQRVIDFNVRSRIDIQPSEISNYYNEHIDDYIQPEQVAARSIFIKLKSARTPIESRQLAQDVREMILDGGEFDKLATNYSEGPGREHGGDIGYIKRGQLLREVDNVIFFLKLGEVSDVIESPVGYHIFKIYDRKEEEKLSFDDVRHKVMQTLYRIEAQERLEDYIERLKSDAYISVK